MISLGDILPLEMVYWHAVILAYVLPEALRYIEELLSTKITARPQKACTHQSGFIQSISVFFQVDSSPFTSFILSF
jgi:hypothetical protein